MGTLKWIRYRVNRSLAENLRHCREEIEGHSVRLAAVMLVPNVPFRRMRLMALRLSPRGFLAFNENLNHFMLRPSSAPTIARHMAWRAKNTLRWTVRAARTADWGLLRQYAMGTSGGEDAAQAGAAGTAADAAGGAGHQRGDSVA